MLARLRVFCLVAVALLLALCQPLEARSRRKKGDGSRSAPAAVQVVERFTGKVVRVSDGDTCDVEKADGATVRIRIYGVDAPELAQEFGKKSRKYLDRRIFRQTVTVEKFYDDQYGRCVGRIMLDGQDLALELLREGMVWHYVQYSSDQSYAIAERLARGYRGRGADGAVGIPQGASAAEVAIVPEVSRRGRFGRRID